MGKKEKDEQSKEATNHTVVDDVLQDLNKDTVCGTAVIKPEAHYDCVGGFTWFVLLMSPTTVLHVE